MIRILATALLALSLTASGAFATSVLDLVIRDWVAYKKFTDVPFTGKLDEGMLRGAYENGKEVGPWVAYNDDGEVMWKLTLDKDGKKEGPSVGYHMNGQLSWKGEYKNNKEEGPWVSYYEDGRLEKKGEYKNGEKEGPWVGYHDNGVLRYQGAFKNGKEEGPWVYYDKDGTKNEDKSGTYRDGEKVSD